MPGQSRLHTETLSQNKDEDEEAKEEKEMKWWWWGGCITKESEVKIKGQNYS